MKNLKKYVIYIALAATAIACKKEHLPQGTNTSSPVFYFRGNVNSQYVNLQAGVNNYYMYSSCPQDGNSVYNFTGYLHQIGCTTCSNSINITINDNKALAPGGSETSINTSLAAGNYAYKGTKSLTGFTVNYIPLPDPNRTPSTYNWSFGDGGTSASPNPSHTFTPLGTYTTSLTIKYSDSSSASASDAIGYGTPNTSIHPTLSYVIDTTLQHKDSVIFTASVSGGTPPYTYHWDFGNGNTANSAGNSITNTYDSVPAIYNTSVKVTDNNGNSGTVHKHVDVNYDPNCYANFTVSSITPDSSNDIFSVINISYTDASGDVYSSANVTQSSTSNFQILSESAYQNNENNQLTRQVHVQFNCTLKDISGKTMTINGGDAVIAVAYK